MEHRSTGREDAGRPRRREASSQRARSRQSQAAASALPCGVPDLFSKHHGHQSCVNASRSMSARKMWRQRTQWAKPGRREDGVGWSMVAGALTFEVKTAPRPLLQERGAVVKDLGL